MVPGHRLASHLVSIQFTHTNRLILKCHRNLICIQVVSNRCSLRSPCTDRMVHLGKRLSPLVHPLNHTRTIYANHRLRDPLMLNMKCMHGLLRLCPICQLEVSRLMQDLRIISCLELLLMALFIPLILLHNFGQSCPRHNSKELCRRLSLSSIPVHLTHRLKKLPVSRLDPSLQLYQLQ